MSSWKPEIFLTFVKPVAQISSKTIYLECHKHFFFLKVAYLILGDHTIPSAFVSLNSFS